LNRREPRVFYRDDDVTVWLGDNRDVLPLLSPESVDVVVTSPPYNTGIVGNGHLKPSGFRKESSMAKNLEKMTSGYTDTIEEEEYQAQQIELLRGLTRVLVPAGSVFYNHKLRWREKRLIHPLDWVRRTALQLRMELIWDRGVGLTLNARRFYDQDERIYWLYKGDDWRWNQEAVGYGSVWRIPPQNYKEHACVFPEALVGRCLAGVARPGDTILDPYAGSGTVGAVARKFGCKAILIEAEEKYCEVIVERLAQTVLPMFNSAQEEQPLL
jgi:DNA modification methylase